MRHLLLALAFLPLPALANDGWGGLTATGLTFGQTDDVAMVSEDLTITPDRISVDYVFRNLTAQDVTGEVIFPLPPISLLDVEWSSLNLPEDLGRDNLLGFRAQVDGRKQQVKIDRVAVLVSRSDGDRPASAQYDTPGKDVTALLTDMGIPLTLDVDKVRADLARLPAARLKKLMAAGLVIGNQHATDDPVPEPAWSVVLRYHWTQTFPAGQEVRVQHDYENRPEGSVFSFDWPPQHDYQQRLAEIYCIDGPTGRKIMSTIHSGANGAESNYASAWYIHYVLRTANSWAGPIGRFHLTLDKGDTVNALSVCMPGLEKTGPTKFEVTKKNWSPPDDLTILLVKPRGGG